MMRKKINAAHRPAYTGQCAAKSLFRFYFACARPLAESSICVPLSKCTLRVGETIMEPCVALDVAELSESPSMPKTPLLFEASRPADVNPPTDPVDRDAAPRVPPALPEAEPAVFTRLPVPAPAADLTPPTNPPPLCAPPPHIAPIPPPLTMPSSAAPFAADRPTALACVA